MVFEEFDRRVRAWLEELANEDIKEDLKDPHSGAVASIKQTYKRGWSVGDTVSYIRLQSQELDEDEAIRKMIAIEMRCGTLI